MTFTRALGTPSARYRMGPTSRAPDIAHAMHSGILKHLIKADGNLPICTPKSKIMGHWKAGGEGGGWLQEILNVALVSYFTNVYLGPLAVIFLIVTALKLVSHGFGHNLASYKPSY